MSVCPPRRTSHPTEASTRHAGAGVHASQGGSKERPRGVVGLGAGEPGSNDRVPHSAIESLPGPACHHRQQCLSAVITGVRQKVSELIRLGREPFLAKAFQGSDPMGGAMRCHVGGQPSEMAGENGECTCMLRKCDKECTGSGCVDAPSGRRHQRLQQEFVGDDVVDHDQLTADLIEPPERDQRVDDAPPSERNGHPTGHREKRVDGLFDDHPGLGARCNRHGEGQLSVARPCTWGRASRIRRC